MKVQLQVSWTIVSLSRGIMVTRSPANLGYIRQVVVCMSGTSR